MKSSSKIRLAGTVEDSIVDGVGLRHTIFLQGCPHHCKGCQNPQTWDYDKGDLVSVEDILAGIISDPLIDGVTISGGEPFEQSEALLGLLQILKLRNYSVWVYTGYLWEDIKDNPIVPLVDVIVDGKFEIDKMSYNLLFRGSSNQRLINVPASLGAGTVIEWKA